MQIGPYQFKKELGSGTFGVTYLATDTTTGLDVAVKTINLGKSEAMGIDLRAVEEEIGTLKDLTSSGNNQYIAAYIDSFRGNFDGADTMFIISEYINGASLEELIFNGGTNYDIAPYLLHGLMTQCLLGLNYIHSRGYAHRDIKPANIMVAIGERNGVRTYTIKYIDFGLACVAKCKVKTCNNKCEGMPGTLLYMAPEVFSGSFKPSFVAAKALDMWALTMVFYELAGGSYRLPFVIDTATGSPLDDEKLKLSIAGGAIYTSDYKHDNGLTDEFLTRLSQPVALRPTAKRALNMLLTHVIANFTTVT